MKKVKILFSSFPDYSGNSKALYEYIKQNYENFELKWVCYDEQNINVFKQNKIKYILHSSEKFNEKLEDIDIIFDTHGGLLINKLYTKKCIYVNLWHGIGPKKIGYLLKQSQLAKQDEEFYELASESTDYIIVPSEFWVSVFSSLFNVNSQRILSLGMPRCDYLLNSNGKRNLEILTGLKVKKFKKILFYLPTFRKGIGRNDGTFLSNILNLHDCSQEELIKYLEQEQMLLVIKMHPSEQSKYEKVNYKNIVYLDDDKLLENNISLYELVNCADMLITDYSSIYVEYLLLKKPILFIHTDIKKYTQKRSLIFNNNEFWFPGPTIINFKEFISETQKLFNDNQYYETEREEFRKLMFDSKIKHNCKNICDYFFDENGICSYLSKSKDGKFLLNEKIDNCNNMLKEKNDYIWKLETELESIHCSRTWKIIQIIKKIIRK